MKNFILAMLTLCLCTCLHAQNKIRLAPGVNCFVWNENTKNKPDSVPCGGFVDEAVKFSVRNIDVCDELKNITEAAFIMWEGYLQIPKTDDYRFTLVSNEGHCFNIKIFLNNKPLFTRNYNDSETLTAQAKIKRGFVKIRIYFNPFRRVRGHGYPPWFDLKFSPKMAMKMTSITPGILFHPVDSER